MAQAFAGTATGNVYVAGRVYERAGEKYRAEADGSFTNLRTGRSSVGSSVQVAAAEAAAKAAAAKRAAEAAKTAGPGVRSVGAARSAGAGNAVVGVGKPATVGAGVGVVVVGRDGIGSTSEDDVYIGGFRMPRNPGTSPAQDIENLYGEADSPLNSAWWAVQAANATHLWAGAVEFIDWARGGVEGALGLPAKWAGQWASLPGTELANPYPGEWPPRPSDPFVVPPTYQNPPYTGNEVGIWHPPRGGLY